MRWLIYPFDPILDDNLWYYFLVLVENLSKFVIYLMRFALLVQYNIQNLLYSPTKSCFITDMKCRAPIDRNRNDWSKRNRKSWSMLFFIFLLSRIAEKSLVNGYFMYVMYVRSSDFCRNLFHVLFKALYRDLGYCVMFNSENVLKHKTLVSFTYTVDFSRKAWN